jgi:hypothetical protein
VSRHAAARRPRSAWLTLWTIKAAAAREIRRTRAAIAADLHFLLHDPFALTVFLGTLLAVTIAVQLLGGFK